MLVKDYTISRKDVFGKNKTLAEYNDQKSELHYIRRHFELKKNQIVRRAEGRFNTRPIAYIWDAHQYITEKHQELKHAVYKKIFSALQ